MKSQLYHPEIFPLHKRNSKFFCTFLVAHQGFEIILKYILLLYPYLILNMEDEILRVNEFSNFSDSFSLLSSFSPLARHAHR